LRHPATRILSPYKSFLTNQIKYTAAAIGPRGIKTNPKRALRFAAMTFLLAGVAGNPIMYGMFLSVAMILKRLFGYDLRKDLQRAHKILGGKIEIPPLYRGIFGALGLDISGSVAIHLPTPERWRDYFGRYGQGLLELSQLAWKKFVTGEGTVFHERKLARLKYPAQALRIMDSMDIFERGEYTTPITKTPVAITSEPVWLAAIKRALGMLPTDVATTFDRERIFLKQKRKYRSISQDLTERWATAVKNNDVEAQQKIFVQVSRRLVNATKKLGRARTDDEMFEALTEVMFYKRWIESNQHFKNALERKFVPRQLQKPMNLPKYLRPEATREMIQ
jgi:hypothetical protein